MLKQHVHTASAGMTRRLFLGSLAAVTCTAASPVLSAPVTCVLAATYPVCVACTTLLRDVPGFELDLLVAAQTGCPHDYAMSPRDRMKLEDCDVLVLNGGGYESFLDEKLLASIKAKVINAGEGIDSTIADTGRGLPEDADHDDHHHGTGNPHYFCSPSHFARMVSAVAGGLATCRPEHAYVLQERAESFAKRMDTLLGQMAGLGGDTLIVAQHDTLSWYFSDTPFKVVAVLQEEADDVPSAATLLGIVERMRDGRSYLLAGEAQFPPHVLVTLAAETGWPRVMLETMASGPMPVPEDWYETVMCQNLDRLREILEA